jgi:hypothetical protein
MQQQHRLPPRIFISDDAPAQSPTSKMQTTNYINSCNNGCNLLQQKKKRRGRALDIHR